LTLIFKYCNFFLRRYWRQVLRNVHLLLTDDDLSIYVVPLFDYFYVHVVINFNVIYYTSVVKLSTRSAVLLILKIQNYVKNLRFIVFYNFIVTHYYPGFSHALRSISFEGFPIIFRPLSPLKIYYVGNFQQYLKCSCRIYTGPNRT